MSVPVWVPGSKTLHLVPERHVGDAWVHVPGWTFCGMEPGITARPGTAALLCTSCDDWLRSICDLAYGPQAKPKDDPPFKGWPWRKEP